jgi:hypothetical protein
MALANSERPAPSRSRIHKARHILGELRRLRLKVERAHALAKEPDEAQWCRSAAEKLDALILAGDAVLGGFADPRESGRVTKRKMELF